MKISATCWSDCITSALKYIERYQRDVPRLESQREYLLATLAQAWHRQEYAHVVQLTHGLAYLAGRLGSLDEGKQILLWGIAASQHLQDEHQLALFLQRLSSLHQAGGEFRAAQRAWEESRALTCPLRCPLHLWEPLSSFASLYDFLRGTGRGTLERLLTEMVSRKDLDRECLAVLLLLRAFNARLAGALARAADDLQASLELAILPQSGTTAYTCFFEMEVRAEMARLDEDYERARHYAEIAIALAQLFCDDYIIIALMLDQCIFAYKHGRFIDARLLALSLVSVAHRIHASNYIKCGEDILNKISIKNTKGDLYDIDILTSIYGQQSRSDGEETLKVHTGQRSSLPMLSEREMAVLQLVASGLSNTEIAIRLAIRPATVKKHLEHIFSKLSAHSRTQAAARARRLGLLP